jgi:hypothetical protein
MTRRMSGFNYRARVTAHSIALGAVDFYVCTYSRAHKEHFFACEPMTLCGKTLSDKPQTFLENFTSAPRTHAEAVGRNESGRLVFEIKIITPERPCDK